MKEPKLKITVNNALELGEDIYNETYGKGRKFTSRFIEAGLIYYEQCGDTLIKKETIDKFINTMIGCPVIIDHIEIYDSNADDERVGVVSDVWYNEKDGWFYCSGVIWNKDAISLVKDFGWSVSCFYISYDVAVEPGTYYHAKPYDVEVKDGVFMHLALVDCPRYEDANIVINSKNKQDIETYNQTESVYITRAERLEAGRKYF